MLAKLQSSLPVGPSWRYEPKLDGFRGLLWRSTDTMVRLFSRNGRDLARWFPELVRTGMTLPIGTLVDGEIVIADERGCPDFGALQNRLTVARKQTVRVASQRPAVLVAFDVLQLAGTDLTDSVLDERRAHLERLISGQQSCLQLVLQTDDIDMARDWLKLLTTIEGVVAKRGDGRYGAGRRPEWVKVKRYRTVDCVVIGVAGESHAPRLVLGLRHADNAVHHLGVTAAIPHAATAPLLALIDRAGPLETAIPSRWQHDAVPPWRRVPPEPVCEVSARHVPALATRPVADRLRRRPTQ